MSRTVALIVAAGRGVRAGTASPKQFVTVAGRPMIAHSRAALLSHPAIDSVLVVIAQGQEATLHDALGPVPFVTGGETRRDSVRAGLEALAEEGDVTRVLIHDAARPFIPREVIDRLLEALTGHTGAVPALPVADTLVRESLDIPAASGIPAIPGGVPAADVMGETVSRDGLLRVQTPQAFRFEAVLDAHRMWPDDKEATDDAQMLRASGHAVAIVAGDAMLEKVTHPQDFQAAESRLSSTLVSRSATGFDVHRFAEGEELWLGGINIPHTMGLAGHSDADVALHALTDALLGTVGEGDIGLHFPPSDAQWRGAASARFVEHAATLIAAHGGIIDFVDLTLICEAPKIGPHRAAIRARVAALLQIPEERVSIKATTTERLGFTGRGEGIAAQAIATVRVPEARR